MNCKRCGKPGKFKSAVYKRRNSDFCEACQCRNLMDGLNLPTPPEMLDKYTRNFTLTQEEFQKKMFKRVKKRYEPDR